MACPFFANDGRNFHSIVDMHKMLNATNLDLQTKAYFIKKICDVIDSFRHGGKANELDGEIRTLQKLIDVQIGLEDDNEDDAEADRMDTTIEYSGISDAADDQNGSRRVAMTRGEMQELIEICTEFIVEEMDDNVNDPLHDDVEDDKYHGIDSEDIADEGNHVIFETSADDAGRGANNRETENDGEDATLGESDVEEHDDTGSGNTTEHEGALRDADNRFWTMICEL